MPIVLEPTNYTIHHCGFQAVQQTPNMLFVSVQLFHKRLVYRLLRMGSMAV